MYFFLETKTIHEISYVGLGLCTIGEVLRKSAIWTARDNFTHLVQQEKIQTHSLVTHGVYSWFRHPSYVGWFYWCIGTQVVIKYYGSYVIKFINQYGFTQFCYTFRLS